jgi:hypothetical protein
MPPRRVPLNQRPIFHITHVTNLNSIARGGSLLSDALCRAGAAASSPTNIGYSHIKDRRLRRRVPVAAGGYLGDYVPFNFCPRSVMLYLIHRGHDNYSGGQADVVHLRSTIDRAVATGQPWAFTDRHAEVAHALYFDDLDELTEVDWRVMPLRYWNDPPDVRERRQAEFLVHERLAWSAIVEIGCMTEGTKAKVERSLAGIDHPDVTIRPEWYY